MPLSFKRPKAKATTSQHRPLPDRAESFLRQAEREAQVPSVEFRRGYHADLDLCLQWLGPLAYYRKEGADRGPCHAELCLHLGAECLLLIGDSSYRSWMTPGEGDEAQWGRWIWRRALMFGTGHLVAHRRIVRPRSGHTWSPLLEPAETALGRQGFGLRDSGRPLDPWALEQALFTQVYGGSLSDCPAMLGLALADSFAVKPNLDNPFAMSIKRAARKLSQVTPTPLPYWWRAALHEWIGFVETTEAEDGPEKAVAPEGPHGERGGRVEPESLEAVPEAGPAQGDQQGSEYDEQMEWLVRTSCEVITKGEVGINDRDALVHRIHGRVCLVVPKFWEWLLVKTPKKWKLQTGDLMRLAVDAGFVVGDDEGKPRAVKAVVHRQDGVGVAEKLKLAALARDYGDRLAAQAAMEGASPVTLEEG